MKGRKEILAWLTAFVLASIGCLIFVLFVPPKNREYNAAFPWMFDVGPAFFATIALTSLFLLLRFYIKGSQAPGKTRFRHVAVALLISLAGVVSWEVARVALEEQEAFRPGNLLGGLGACLVTVLLWLLIRIWVREKREKSLPSKL